LKQLQILTPYLNEDINNVSKAKRHELMQKTGLSWLQIYKWTFDRKKRKASDHVYSRSFDSQVFIVINKHGKDISRSLPVFTTERACNTPPECLHGTTVFKESEKPSKKDKHTL
jgi:hypothetical protein